MLSSYENVLQELQRNVVNSYYLQLYSDIIHNNFVFNPKWYLDGKNRKGERHFMDNTMNNYYYTHISESERLYNIKEDYKNIFIKEA